MCGRFSLKTKPGELVDHFDLVGEPVWTPRFNIAPTQSTGVVRMTDSGRIWTELTWGLVPGGAPDAKGGGRLINARIETVRENPSFRVAFEHRRCLIPFDGFYEWKNTIHGKQPIHFRRADQAVMAFAGLWDRWTGAEGEVLETFTILTTEPNEFVRESHDRMPVILNPADYLVWLNSSATSRQLLDVAGSAPEELLEAVEVNQVVNGTSFDGPECLDPPSPPIELDLFG